MYIGRKRERRRVGGRQSSRWHHPCSFQLSQFLPFPMFFWACLRVNNFFVQYLWRSYGTFFFFFSLLQQDVLLQLQSWCCLWLCIWAVSDQTNLILNLLSKFILSVQFIYDGLRWWFSHRQHNLLTSTRPRSTSELSGSLPPCSPGYVSLSPEQLLKVETWALSLDSTQIKTLRDQRANLSGIRSDHKKRRHG